MFLNLAIKGLCPIAIFVVHTHCICETFMNDRTVIVDVAVFAGQIGDGWETKYNHSWGRKTT